MTKSELLLKRHSLLRKIERRRDLIIRARDEIREMTGQVSDIQADLAKDHGWKPKPWQPAKS